MIGVEDDSVIIVTCNSQMCTRSGGVVRGPEMDKEHIKYPCLQDVVLYFSIKGEAKSHYQSFNHTNHHLSARPEAAVLTLPPVSLFYSFPFHVMYI